MFVADADGVSGLPPAGTATPLPPTGLELSRLRWRCRRGLLELDLLLERFVAQSYARLSAAERVAFDVLLDLPDDELWQMITGRIAQPSDEAAYRVLQGMMAAESPLL